MVGLRISFEEIGRSAGNAVSALFFQKLEQKRSIDRSLKFACGGVNC